MCFTPLVSISTAIIELILAFLLISCFRKSKLTPFFFAVLILLGWYQFSEFMLCTTGNLFWIRFGFIGYTFLPAVGLHSILNYFKIKVNLILLYLVPTTYSLFALFNAHFAISGQCILIFVQVKTLLTGQPLRVIPYILYYALFIILAFAILWKAYLKARTKIQKQIDLSEMMGILLMTIPTFVLIIIFPALGIMFPSVLCHFGLLLGICFFFAAYLDNKMNLHEKFHKK